MVSTRRGALAADEEQHGHDNQPSTSGRGAQAKQKAGGRKASKHAASAPDAAEAEPAVLDGDDSDLEDLLEGQLDAFKSRPEVLASLRQLLTAVADPTAFLQPSTELSQTTRRAAKALYDCSVRALLLGARPADKAEVMASLQGLPSNAFGKGGKGSHSVTSDAAKAKHPVPSLCVEAVFDAEQIWVQLDMAAGAVMKRTRKLIAKTAPLLKAARETEEQGEEVPLKRQAALTLIHPEHEAVVDMLLAEGSGMSDSGSEGSEEDEEAVASDEEDDEGALDSDEAEEAAQKASKRPRVKQTGRQDEASGRQDQEGDDFGKRITGAYDDGWEGSGLHPTEDRFMRLHEMETFLKDSEAKAAQGLLMEGDLDEEDEQNELDYAADSDGDDGDDDMDGDDAAQEDEDEEEAQLRRVLNKTVKLAGKRKKQGDDLFYGDFFGPSKSAQAVAAGRPAKRDGRFDKVSGSGSGSGSGSEEEEEEGQEWGREDEVEGMEDEEEGQEDGEGGAAKAGALVSSSDDEDEAAAKKEAKAQMSSHQRRLMRLQEEIKGLEQAAMGDKVWYLRGEVAAKSRPLNSALEMDMDYDTTVKPPPEPTVDFMADLEALIKKRVVEHRYDDPVRMIAAAEPVQRKRFELDESRSNKGLGEEYADDFMKASGTVVSGPDAQAERLRNEVRAQFQALVVKLDALSHFHFAPKPTVEDLNLKSEVAAVAMEEAAPVAFSAASMRLPAEVFKSGAEGAPKAEEELTQEDRKRQRAKRKRGSKKAKAVKEGEVRARATAAGQALPLPGDGAMPVTGRKSAMAMLAAKATGGKRGARKAAVAAAEAAGAGSTRHARTEFGKSSAVFAKIQELSDVAQAEKAAGKGSDKSGRKGKIAQPGPEGVRPVLAAAFLKL